MIHDVKPVPHLLTVAVDRQGLAVQCIEDHQRDQFFREMVGPVIVAAVGGEYRQLVGVMPGAHEVIGGRLACRVGAVGLVRIRFRERRIVGEQGSVHLVGGYVQEAERLSFGGRQI